MRLRHLLFAAGFGLLAYKLLEGIVIESQEIQTRITTSLPVDLSDLQNKSKEKPKVKVEEDILDEMEYMSEDQIDEFIHDLSDQLNDDTPVQHTKNPKLETKTTNNTKAVVAKTIKPAKSAEPQLSNRQHKILNLLEKNQKVDTDMLSKRIKNVTVRTLRRDLDTLENHNLVKKMGSTRGAYYVSR